MLTGEVKFFDEPRNFGIVIAHDGKEDVFVHRSVVQGTETFDLVPGRWVAFDVVPGYLHPVNRTRKAKKLELCKKRGEHERSAAREREPAKVLPFGTD
ncbi:MAG TPA: cold shock domain-containing protein [Terriglobales bacterium]|nr:cold shock domain-containing protein [Terriglobales bacterium]